MAKLSSDGKSVTVVSGDTLSAIALKYLGSASKYKQLATINNISNPDRIYIGQVIKLYADGSSSSESDNSNKPTINQFGLLSTSNNTVFATWKWSRDNTSGYKVQWSYATQLYALNASNSVWIVGSTSTINVDEDDPELSKQSTYSIPSEAKQIKFKVKPISKKKKVNNVETNYWDADWSDAKTLLIELFAHPPVPAVPSVEVDGYKLTMTLDNVDPDTNKIEFQIIKDNKTTFETTKVSVATGHASYSCTVSAGSEYKVRCRAYSGSSITSEWSNYSASVRTIPTTPSEITECRASSETSVYLAWSESQSADSYDVEYAKKKEYFDGSDQVTIKTGIEYAHYDISGLETGVEYFFRVRAVNGQGESSWSDVKSVVIGADPAAPTTWSSTTTAITGEKVTLYWVHNSEDGSSQTYADLELYVNGVKETHTIENSTDEDLKDKTSFYEIDTSKFIEGTKIQWRVRTAGITKVYGDWSTQRTIDIYAPVTLELSVTDSSANTLEIVESFPFYIRGLPGPNTQKPIGYHVTVTSNDIYDTVDNLGNPKTVNVGEQVYSNYFDTSYDLLVELSAGNIDLENGIEYTVTCTVSMDSGLSTKSSVTFGVSWTDARYVPNAEIGINEDTFTAYIRPYCENRKLMYYKVEYASYKYVKTDEALDPLYGEIVRGKKTTTGERVYSGMTSEGVDIYYCMVEEKADISEVFFSVYRREFDGAFTELAKNLDGANRTTITDPHPALDFARYRIVATSKDTGSVSYYDPPGYPVGGKAAIIQWDEAWSTFETSEEAALEQPPWSGSMLKLPYNIDISDSHDNDVSLVGYIGREHPIGYYGTQRGHASSWSMEIESTDKETLYGLRRLANWMGNVYVREPSGSGYWASVAVSFSQKHCSLTIPVSLNVKRVEGGA